MVPVDLLLDVLLEGRGLQQAGEGLHSFLLTCCGVRKEAGPPSDAEELLERRQEGTDPHHWLFFLEVEEHLLSDGRVDCCFGVLDFRACLRQEGVCEVCA